MARTKKETSSVEEVEQVTADIGVSEEVLSEPEVATEVIYKLNKHNFTAVGNTFLSLCKPTIKIKSTDKKLISSAEEQVKIGVLKKI